jgi:hypothetical protein
MPKLPRLADETYVDASGKRRKRFSVYRVDAYGTGLRYCFEIVDRDCEALIGPDFMLLGCSPLDSHPKGYHAFRSRKSAWNWLKRTTVRQYKVWQVERALDDATA